MAEKKSNFNLNELLSKRSMSGSEEKTGVNETAAEEIMMINVEDLEPSKENFYHVDSGLKTSIAIAGVMEPLTVELKENGKYKIISGHRRHIAVKELVKEGNEDIRYIPCVYKRAGLKDRLAVMLANGFRKKTDFEKMMEVVIYEEEAAEIKKEFKIKGKVREILAELTGLSEAQIGRYKAVYNNLIPELMEEFKNDNIVFSVLVELGGLSKEQQYKAYKEYKETQKITIAEIKNIKEHEKKEVEEAEKEAEEQAEGRTPGQRETKDTEVEQTAEAQEFDPQPETVTSICYSCLYYSDCHEKRSTVTDCNNYINKTEAEKTQEQRYEEEQKKIDIDTKEKLREFEKEKEMEKLISNTPPLKRLEHEIRLSPDSYYDITSGKQPFLILQNKDNYQIGERLLLKEYKAGQATGMVTPVNVLYVLNEHRGIAEGFCILGVRIAINVGDTVWINTSCEYVCTQRDYETGVIECPFENDCEFEECDNGKERLFKTTIESVFNNGNGWNIAVNHLAMDIPINELNRTVFFSEEAAKKSEEIAVSGEKEK